MSINREWHATHKLARDASIEERLHWHIQHSVNCGCREIPTSIKRELEARGMTLPTPRSLK
ncbi:hypothetical protein SAMN04488059_102318 [Devosia psychrophila]|uniref:Uncharacterized protein n=1 Tax=Devosia psychrophila TaxID=728005 RepID=A0A1I1GUW9_9HYPH|nr:hypothetical protein SAMN04488059_102318 [Devosia psychrophila]